MNKTLSVKVLGLYLLCMIVLTGCFKGNNVETTIEIWHHYNDTQKIAFDEMIVEFNETIGVEKGIIVQTFSQGNINELQMTILDSVDKKVGAKEIPNIVTAYPDTARRISDEGLIVDLGKYITNKELEKYVPSYIEEGYLGKDHQLNIFPIAKATEIMMVNKTDWDKFVNATGANIDDLKTWEGLSKTAELYYNWTDSLTEVANDGKAFFGRDAMANYILVGAKQLGQEMFEVENEIATLRINEKIMRRLWDYYYLPYIKGYYSSFGRFSSDDVRTGEIIALVGSTAGATYFPEDVTIGDKESYNIESLILPVPNFENTKPHVIQQGAGMSVLKSDKAHEEASIEFVKWFTQTPKNMAFCLEAGYLPVTKQANIKEVFEKELQQEGEERFSKQLQMALRVSKDQVETYELYQGKAFKNGDMVREFLTKALIDQAKIDREIVVELINEGKTHEEAATLVSRDKNFDQWFLKFEATLEKIIR
ncbi:MAG TPA: extracellular solute-binding protein [Epulopiscium sp.]|nr:extracellular solute-binding protein [Candidatus Epulonipiscium sp.]